MKEHPMLFSTLMVQAILAGRKTQTRRLIKPQPTLQGVVEQFCKEGPGSVNSMDLTKADMEIDSLIENSKWQVGDLIWVREEYFHFGRWDVSGSTKTGKLKRSFIPQDDDICFEPTLYALGETFTLDIRPNSFHLPAWRKRLGRFMPKKYSRIWLKVTDVRVERLLEITEEDAIAEGIEYMVTNMVQGYKDYSVTIKSVIGSVVASPQFSYRTLWESINGKESWEANPWVWVVSFEVISTTGRPQINEHIQHLPG